MGQNSQLTSSLMHINMSHKNIISKGKESFPHNLRKDSFLVYIFVFKIK